MTYPIPLDTMLIELADFCNLQCIMCDMSEEGRRRHGHPNPEKPFHTTQRRFLPFESFKSIIDSINQSDIRIGVLSLFWLGEPLLNPEFNKMLTYLNRNMKNIGGWLLHTNGQILPEETLKLIFESDGNNTLHFSVDAASPELYAKIRKGGNYEKLVANIRKTLDYRAKIPRPNLKLMLQFIVMEENKHEAKKFAEFWGKEFEKRGLRYTIARYYSQHWPNTIFFRQEIAVTKLQEKANKLHEVVCDSLGIPK